MLTLGPPLPKALYSFSMVEIHGDAYAIGGDGGSGNDEESSIHQLSCSSGLCSWTTLNQQLKTGIYILASPEEFS